jgi:hypothetical protein
MRCASDMWQAAHSPDAFAYQPTFIEPSLINKVLSLMKPNYEGSSLARHSERELG